MAPSISIPLAASASDTRFFGHPRGLATLFMTEMWERFSYYGMRALLILFMTAPAATGGLAFPVTKAGAIYGLYAAMSYLLCLPGGWLADTFLGQRRAVLYGGVLISLGNFSLATPGLATFYAGLALVAAGTGLLKPNVSVIVGQLYPPHDTRRDAGFSIFYMGINLGAFLSPLVCGYLGETINWHFGFAAAGVSMALGLIQYVATARHLGEAGLHPTPPASAEAAANRTRQLRRALSGGALVFAALALLQFTGVLAITAEALSNALGTVLVLTVVVFFAWVLFFGRWTPEEKKRLIVVGVLFVAASLFWGIYEQAGSTLNLFAERNTDKHLLGFAFPASWMQSVNALFVIALAPVFAWLWVWLHSREPSSPAKFSMALIFVGVGLMVMIPAALIALGGTLASPWWLILVYFLHTVGEMCLSPVGLSAMTKLAPARITSLLMGVWFLAASVGNFLAGRLASLYETLPLTQLFGVVGALGLAAGLLLAMFVPATKRLMGDVK
jgi:POT family proton-dependent oligopeptide transporter